MRHVMVGVGTVSLLALGLGQDAVSYFEESQPQTMNPLFAKSMSDRRTHELVFDRMFYRSPITNEIMSHIVKENGEIGKGVFVLDGGKRAKVMMRDDVKWHDGKKFSGEDVCFTVNAILNPKTPSPFAKDFKETVESCMFDSKDNAAIITFTKHYHNPRSRLDFSVIPEHVFKGITAIDPAHAFSQAPIGTGPMKGVLGRRGTNLIKVLNGHHDAKIPNLAQSEGGDPLVQVRTIIGGSVDGVISVAPPLRQDVAAASDVALKSYDLRSWWFMAVNTTSGALGDKRVRQALNLALDRSELRTLTIGVDPEDKNPPCEFVSGPFVQSSPYYNRQIKVVEQSDLPMVEALMTSAGATKNAGRWMWKGAPINLRIGMNAPLNNEATDLLNQVGNQLQAAGFDRQVYRVTQADWDQKVVTGKSGGDYDLLIGKWSFGLVEDVNSLFYSRKEGKGSLNIFNYSHPNVDKLLDQYDAAHTDTEAKDAYHDLHAFLADDLPYIFLWKLDTKSAWRNEIRGNVITPYYYFTEFDGWRKEAK